MNLWICRNDFNDFDTYAFIIFLQMDSLKYNYLNTNAKMKNIDQ